jgi:hypothetical protein
LIYIWACRTGVSGITYNVFLYRFSGAGRSGNLVKRRENPEFLKGILKDNEGNVGEGIS